MKGHKYSVTVVTAPAGSDLDLWVWRPGTKDIFQFTIGCFRKGGACPALAAASASPSSDEHAVFRATKTGTYYFQVNSWYSRGRYTLRVKRAELAAVVPRHATERGVVVALSNRPPVRAASPA